MKLKICPSCDKVFYTPSGKEDVICYHCEFILYENSQGEEKAQFLPPRNRQKPRYMS